MLKHRTVWNGIKLIFGGLLMSCSGIALLLYLSMLLTHSTDSETKMMIIPATLLTVLLPGLFGWSLFRRGLKAETSGS